MPFSAQHPVILIMACLAVTSVGCSRKTTTGGDSKTRQTINQPVAVKTVSVVQQETRQTTVQPATVHAFHAASIQARVCGYVLEVRMDIGDPVKAGDILAVISVPEMQKQRLVSAAQVHRQQAEEQRVAEGVKLSKAKLQAAEALAAEAKSKLQQVRATLAAAQAEFERTEDLVKRGSLQPRLLDEVRQRRDSEVAAEAAVKSAIESAFANVNVANAEAAAANAQLLTAEAETIVRKAQLEEIDVLMEYAILTAPFDGVVTQRMVSPGDLVGEQKPQKPLFVISQLDKVRIHIPVPESRAAHVKRGDAVDIVFPSFPATESLSATVTRSEESLDPSTRTMLVEAEVSNSDGRLLPGMFGRASITLADNVAANTLPARAVRFSTDGRAYVYVLSGDTVSIRDVETGIDDGHQIQIVSGLDPGQIVIDAHLQRFTDGQKVRVLN